MYHIDGSISTSFTSSIDDVRDGLIDYSERWGLFLDQDREYSFQIRSWVSLGNWGTLIWIELREGASGTDVRAEYANARFSPRSISDRYINRKTTEDFLEGLRAHLGEDAVT